jgi:isochorismate hydrolase
MVKFILVIILNTNPQYIQVFDNREQCSLTAQLIRKTEQLQSYCVPSGTPVIAEVLKQEVTG